MAKQVIARSQVTLNTLQDGQTGAAGATGPAGVDANLLDWVKEWNTNKTVIGAESLITPKIFAGVKNANGTITGIALGNFSLNTINATGTPISETINGIYSFRDGYKTFSVDSNGNAQLGRGNQYISYNSNTGKIEFGSEVSLNWVSAIATAKDEAVSSAAANTAIQTAQARWEAIAAAATDAANKATQAKADAISAAATDAGNKVSAIQVGTRNYILNSTFNQSAVNSILVTDGVTAVLDIVTRYQGYNTIKITQPAATGTNANTNRAYFNAQKLCSPASFSMWVKASASTDLRLRTGGTGAIDFPIDTTWKLIKLENIIPTSVVVLFGATTAGVVYNIALPMLVEGTKAVDWNPAPEDIAAQLTAVITSAANAQSVADAITKKANDEKWDSKLTYIDGSGIFTGTLSANIVNALSLNASQITAGIINAARIDAGSLKTSLITAANIEALALNVVRGKIGGWSIDSDSIFSGTKNNTSAGYTANASCVTIGSQGIRGFKWRLETNGSGGLAGGNISWDASGNVTFGSSVALNWTTPINAINTALGGSTYPKLTQISSTGIYTGTLTATQITAGTISADRIAAGSINSSKLDVNSIKADIINTSYINGLSCTFVQGKIGGWSIGADTVTVGSIGTAGAVPIQLRSSTAGSGNIYNGGLKLYGLSMLWYQSSNAGHIVFGQVAASGSTVKAGFVGIQMLAWDGTEYFCLSANSALSGSKEVYNRIAGWAFDNTRIWKNNVSLSADGSIVNGTAWKLNNDGSGQLANGNISWNAAGTVTFAPSVSLNWTNAVNTAKTELQSNIDKARVEGVLYCKGTGTNRNANRMLILNGATIYNTAGRGLQLTVISRSDLSVISNLNYDIYGDANKRTELSNALNALNDSVIVVLTSYDAISIDSTLSTAMSRCGGTGVILTYRNPYALVGIPGIGKGNGIEIYAGDTATAPFAEITTRIVNGIPQGINTVQGMALQNAANAQSLADKNLAALGGSSYPKVTKIDSNGIYTGTLTASQITAGTISADRIAANSINSSKLDAASIKADIINAGYVNGLNCSFVQGKIGGWTIGADTITAGSIGTAGAIPIQIRSVSSGSGYVYSGQYKPYGLTMTWHQSSNAGHFVFGQVMSAGNAVKTGFIGLQMMAWDNTEYFCLSANSALSGSKEVYNRIAGWAFDNDSIYRGAKNNASGAYTGASGEITIGSNGIRGFKWRLDSTGAGAVAAGNISWDASGNVTFAPSVSLNWTNAANNALASAQAYADTKKTEAINTAATDATTKANAAKELAQAMAFGKMLYRDPVFYNGNNGIGVYNNSNNGTVTVTRTADTNAPNDSKQALVIKNTGTSSPNCGGFFWGTATSYRKVFITRIIAKIPAGRDISYHSNSIGTGGSQKWLTPVAGTGDWCEYTCKVTCGTANFSTTHFFAVSGNVGTAENPVEWRLAYATVLDVTSTEKYTTTIDANGIYTGTIQAGQVLIDSALVVGGSTYNGSISVRDASNTVKVTLDRTGITAVGGTIGGWVIGSAQISKNSVILSADGSITNGTLWRLNNDGSGQVANGNVYWTAAGAVTITGVINATSGKIGGFTISGNKLINTASDSAIEFSTLSGSSSLSINGSTSTLLSMRADSARTALSIQTYATGAKGIYIIANAGSTYAIESYGPHQLGQRYGERWNAPGVLFSAVVRNSSTLYNSWGNGLTITSFVKERTGWYTVRHNLGHTNYTVITSPYLDDSTGSIHTNSYIRVEYINTTYFNLRVVNADNGGLVDTAFTFAIIGRNIW